VVDEARLRTLDVKRHACGEPSARATVVALLVGFDRTGPSELAALDLLGTWRAAAPDDGLPHYLLARKYLELARYAEAAVRLDQALSKRIALARVRNEALRLRLRAACAQADAPAAHDAFRRYAEAPGVPAARIAAARALLERCVEAGGG
jgi:thioredoxin-like negative regulator of GroEL